MPLVGWNLIRLRNKYYSYLTINFRKLLRNSIDNAQYAELSRHDHQLKSIRSEVGNLKFMQKILNQNSLRGWMTTRFS